MAENDLRERLRLALSYVDKARRLGDAHHIGASERLLAAVRADLVSEMETLGARLRVALAKGGAADDALAPLRARLAALNRLAASQDPEALGGAADRPLTEYAPRFRQRFTLLGIEVVPSRRGFAIWLALMAFAVGGMLVYAGWRPDTAGLLSIEVMPAGLASRSIIRLLNTGSSEARVLVPSVPDGPTAEEAEVPYGLSVAAKPAGPGEFQPLPPIPQCWMGEGGAFLEPRVIAVPAGLFVDLTWDAAPLAQIGLPADSLQFRLFADGNRLLAAAQTGP